MPGCDATSAMSRLPERCSDRLRMLPPLPSLLSRGSPASALTRPASRFRNLWPGCNEQSAAAQHAELLRLRE